MFSFSRARAAAVCLLDFSRRASNLLTCDVAGGSRSSSSRMYVLLCAVLIPVAKWVKIGILELLVSEAHKRRRHRYVNLARHLFKSERSCGCLDARSSAFATSAIVFASVETFRESFRENGGELNFSRRSYWRAPVWS